MNSASTELPSSRSLLRSTLIAAAVAVALLVTTVLPAEYGVDPTGIGGILGLTEMGRVKVALAREAATADSVERANPQAAAAARGVTSAPVFAEASPAAATAAAPVADSTGTAAAGQSSDSQSGATSHVTEIVLRPNQGKEIKLVMRKGARVTYSWSTNTGVVNYDTHADAPGIKYHGYAKGSGKRIDEGVLVAAFDGAHGWFWRNRGRDAVTITLRTSGDYQELKRM